MTSNINIKHQTSTPNIKHRHQTTSNINTKRHQTSTNNIKHQHQTTSPNDIKHQHQTSNINTKQHHQMTSNIRHQTSNIRFINILNENGLSQHTKEVTRPESGNILDLNNEITLYIMKQIFFSLPLSKIQKNIRDDNKPRSY